MADANPSGEASRVESSEAQKLHNDVRTAAAQADSCASILAETIESALEKSKYPGIHDPSAALAYLASLGDEWFRVHTAKLAYDEAKAALRDAKEAYTLSLRAQADNRAREATEEIQRRALESAQQAQQFAEQAQTRNETMQRSMKRATWVIAGATIASVACAVVLAYGALRSRDTGPTVAPAWPPPPTSAVTMPSSFGEQPSTRTVSASPSLPPPAATPSLNPPQQPRSTPTRPAPSGKDNPQIF
jgi:hypothetical protein